MDAVNFQVLFNIACVLVGAFGTTILRGIFERLKELAAVDTALALKQDLDTKDIVKKQEETTRDMSKRQEETTRELHALALALAQNYPTKTDMKDLREAMKEMGEEIKSSLDKVFERLDHKGQ